MSDEILPPETPVENEEEDLLEEEETLESDANIQEIQIISEMERSYIDYSMSVIVGRALPDARDGLKPVHRRCIFGMRQLGNTHDKPYLKSARAVGEVMGKYHPHGDASIYDTIVRLAQDFSMRYLVVDGHGNFGSIDGDGAAAARYTEVRMKPFAEEMLSDIEKDTVDMVPNYDEKELEPAVLPSKLPNLLLNGSVGIAVGMATNIPTHNLNEVCDAVIAQINDPGITTEGLMQYIKGPDFPTGGIICGVQGIRDMYTTGRGTMCVRGKAECIEPAHKGQRPGIVITEVPYGVNKAEMVAKIGELGETPKEKNGIPEIEDIRDVSSDKGGIRVEIELSPGTYPEAVLSKLYKLTPLQTNFSANMLALDHGRPQCMTLKQILRCFIEHRREVITRRTRFLLEKAEARVHILKGLRIATDHIDEVIQIIRSSHDDAETKARLLEHFGLDDIQSSAILEMRLRALQGLQREKLEEEYNTLLENIERYKFILDNPGEVLNMIKQDCEEMKEKYGDARRTEIQLATGDVDVIDLVPPGTCVVTLSKKGYIKRCNLGAFREMRRGSMGRTGAKAREEDLVTHVFTPDTHDRLLFFTDQGRVLTCGAWEIKEQEPNALGTALSILLKLREEIKPKTYDAEGRELAPRPAEHVVEIVPVPDFRSGKDDVREAAEKALEGKSLIFATRKGRVKRTPGSLFRNINVRGIIAINLEEDDALIEVIHAEAGDELILFSEKGRASRFTVAELRAMGRTAAGVLGMRLEGVKLRQPKAVEGEEGADAKDEDAVDTAPNPAEDDEDGEDSASTDGTPDAITGLVKVSKQEAASHIFILAENGKGLIAPAESFPTKHRGTKGVIALKRGASAAKVVFASCVNMGRPATETEPEVLADTLVALTSTGKVLRTNLGAITPHNRNTQGVKVVGLDQRSVVIAADITATEPATETTETTEAAAEVPAETAPEAPETAETTEV